MKVKDLIKELQKFDGNLNVRVIADHGQVAEPVSGVSEEYIDDEGNCIHPDDIDDTSWDTIEVVIGGQ